jgi:integrase
VTESGADLAPGVGWPAVAGPPPAAGPVVEGELLPAGDEDDQDEADVEVGTDLALVDPGPPKPGDSVASQVRAAVWQPEGKIAEALAKVLDGYDPDGQVAVETAQMFAEYSLARNTLYAYAYQIVRFVVWCGDGGRRHLPDPDEPPERWLTEMVTNCRDWVAANYTMRRADGRLRGRDGQPYSPDTVRLSLAAISKLYERRGHTVAPTHHQDVRGQVRAYSRRWASERNKRDIAYVPTWAELVAMARSCDLGTVAGIRDAFLVRLAAETGRRNSELMAMNWDDITELTPGAVWRIDFPTSKTNPYGDRVDQATVQADQGDGPDNPPLAPDVDTIRLGQLWRQVCRQRNLVGKGLPAFVKVRTGTRRKDGSVSGVILPERMTRTNYQDVVRAVGHRSGVLYDPVTGEVRKLVPHSFRAYMATWGAAAGLPLAAICDQGGWNRNSPVVLRYMRLGATLNDNNPGVRIRQLALRQQREDEERRRRLAEAGMAEGG